MSYTLEWFWVLCFGNCSVTLEFVGQAMTLTLNHVNILYVILLRTLSRLKNSCVVFYQFRACLHRGGRPQVGEGARLAAGNTTPASRDEVSRGC